MLSRTADHLYWMARYTERAENTARMLDVAVQTSMLPQSAFDTGQAWRAMLGISELRAAFDARHAVLDAKNVLAFMATDPGNPSSIVSCLTAARENARAVRGVLTTEVWETQNATWIELRERAAVDGDPSAFFDWVKHRCHLSRGVTVGTMLDDEALVFIRLGTFLERADNTARLLDVKYHGAKSSATHDMLTQREFYYWSALLRSVAGFETYRKVYRDSVTPSRVAELLMLRADMPRSLLACMAQVVANLKAVRNDVSSETERLAGKMHAELQFARIEDILAAGIDDTLGAFMENIYALGNGISRDFLVPLGA
ncbi:alpha-E domain-containing protein [Massilia niastensis]|uniref:alpha-E domain-containing protein n=1 Tax=Massilia niastensis TaxID=544911 RepID=UPI0004782A29|nr:alpha-E domain-containing protein [Massilia niastensis]